jgi:hypothetical protein
MYVRMYVCTYVHMYVCTYVHMYVCMYVCMYCVCVCVCIYTYTHRYIASVMNTVYLITKHNVVENVQSIELCQPILQSAQKEM